MARRKPSKTRRTTISISEDLSADFDALAAFADAAGMSISRYLITAAVLCMNAGIDDPAAANVGDLAACDHAPDQADATTTTNGDIDRALDRALGF
jgi:hypothetical protein